MLMDENWWTWERAMEHAQYLAERYLDHRYRVYKTKTSLGWTVTYADPRPR